MKLALFNSVEYESIRNAPRTEDYEKHDNWVRTTEYMDVDFTPLQQAQIIHAQVVALDKAAEELGNKYMEGLNAIKQRKEELLALEHQL